jgi:ATP-dependent Lon protease
MIDIDKVTVPLRKSDYWAELVNFGHRNFHIPGQDVHDFDRLLTGGVWLKLM